MIWFGNWIWYNKLLQVCVALFNNSVINLMNYLEQQTFVYKVKMQASERHIYHDRVHSSLGKLPARARKATANHIAVIITICIRQKKTFYSIHRSVWKQGNTKLSLDNRCTVIRIDRKGKCNNSQGCIVHVCIVNSKQLRIQTNRPIK